MTFNKSNVIVSGSRSSLSEYANYTTVYPKPAMVGGKIVLTQDMINKQNVKYIIKWNFDLDDETITVPEGCLIEFDGGSFSNGTLVGNETILVYNQEEKDVFKNVSLEGSFERSTSAIADKMDNTNGMAKIYLKKNKPLATQLTQPNTIYVIQYDFTLGEDITIPENCVLEFDGGSISGGNITGKLQEIGYPEWYQGNDDDYTAIARCMSICKTVCFKPNKIYNVYGQVKVKENRIIKGNSATINLYKKPDSPTVLFGIESNAQIYDLNIESKESDLQRNRVNMTNVENIIIENCTFSGFLNPTDRNAHTLYYKHSHDIIVRNCRIYNTTRDIAITEDCYNLFFHNVICTTVDIEPSEFVITHHIVFKDCTITNFLIYENQLEYSIRDVQVLSSIIQNLIARGGLNITFNNCSISNVETNISLSNVCWATNISINNIPLGPELVLNPYLINLNTNKDNIKIGEFCCGYTSSNKAIGKKKIDGINAIALNPLNNNIVMDIRSVFNVKPDTTYQLKWVSKSSFLDAKHVKALKFVQLDAEDNTIQTAATSYISSESTSFIEYTIYIKTLPECDKLSIYLYNGNAGSKSTVCAYIQTVSLREVLTAPQATLYVNNADMGYRLHMETYANAQNETLNFVDDTVKINNIEYICIEEGNPVKWKSNKGYINSGVTASRPLGMHVETIDDVETLIGSLANGDVGFEYFDTTLGKPIYAKVINNSTGVVTWVDATGATI